MTQAWFDYLAAAWGRGEKFAPRPKSWERPLPPGVHAIEDFREVCARVGVKCPIPERA